MASNTRAHTSLANTGHMAPPCCSGWELGSVFTEGDGGSPAIVPYASTGKIVTGGTVGSWSCCRETVPSSIARKRRRSRVVGFSHGAKRFTEQCPRPLSLPEGDACTVKSVARNGLSCQAKLPAGHN